MRKSYEGNVARILFSTLIIVPLALSPAILARAETTLKCEIISVKNTAWAKKINASVKSTLDVGDYLEAGDILEVKRGNVVQIAFDAEQSNILHVEGPTTMEIQQLGNTKLDMKEGKVFALLDNLQQGQTFNIATPTAIAAVRGTQYKVESYGLVTDLAVYKGTVRAYSRESDGSASKSYFDVKLGQKLNFDGFSKKPSTPSNMSLDEASEISDIQWKTKETKSKLTQEGFKSNIDVESEWDMSSAAGAKDEEGNAVIY